MSQLDDFFEIILSVVTHSLNKLGASGGFAGKLLEKVESKSREVILVEKKLNLQIIHFYSQNLLPLTTRLLFRVVKFANLARKCCKTFFY